MSYYSVLDVSVTATSDDIKKSYRKLAMLHHPDKGGNEDTFKKINEAYSVLSDDTKRAAYDQQSSNQAAGSTVKTVFNTVFNTFFTAMNFNFNRPRRNLPNENMKLKIPLENALLGGFEKKLKKTLVTMCPTCTKVCDCCKGQGYVMHNTKVGNVTSSKQLECALCKTVGLVYTRNADCRCEDGKTKNIVDINVFLKPHECLKQVITYTGVGAQPQSFLENASNFVIQLEIDTGRPDLTYNKNTGQITYRPKVQLSDMVFGCTIHVPYEGLQVQLDAFQVRPGLTITFPNHGLHRNEHGDRADLIVIPDVNYDEELEVDLDLLRKAVKTKSARNDV